MPPPGDCVGILGNNGVGKSTLITCLNGIRRPDRGTIRVDGKNVWEMSRGERARTIAYVAQKNELGRTTVYDAVLLGRKPYMGWGMTSRDYGPGICAAAQAFAFGRATSNLDLRNQYEMMKLVCHRFLFVKNGLVYDYGNASIVTEQALGDVYGICATLLTCHNKKFAIME